ncbi:hypothetical protein Taro_014601 [Colocasia esculenta]|uniref:Uncharacterized protein n=1 Tax=Colocasia esculenta TaxID=4460 RepID=A0A843UJ71_COLES|nr:hypothetical protein [Colocasia esculenta]
MLPLSSINGQTVPLSSSGQNTMASRGRRGGAPARKDEPRREERAEQQAPAPQGPILPPPPPVDYGLFMQGLEQAMQTQAHTQAALQDQLEAQDAEQEKHVTEGLVGDPTSLEETVESDSERGE